MLFLHTNSITERHAFCTPQLLRCALMVPIIAAIPPPFRIASDPAISNSSSKTPGASMSSSTGQAKTPSAWHPLICKVVLRRCCLMPVTIAVSPPARNTSCLVALSRQERVFSVKNPMR
eukprot:2930662-Rhodomonas_salina.2